MVKHTPKVNPELPKDFTKFLGQFNKPSTVNFSPKAIKAEEGDIVINSPEGVELCNDRAKLLQTLEREGIPTPPSIHILKDVMNNMSFDDFCDTYEGGEMVSVEKEKMSTHQGRKELLEFMSRPRDRETLMYGRSLPEYKAEEVTFVPRLHNMPLLRLESGPMDAVQNGFINPPSTKDLRPGTRKELIEVLRHIADKLALEIIKAEIIYSGKDVVVENVSVPFNPRTAAAVRWILTNMAIKGK